MKSKEEIQRGAGYSGGDQEEPSAERKHWGSASDSDSQLITRFDAGSCPPGAGARS